MFGAANSRLTIELGIKSIHLWHLAKSLDHGITNNVCEGDLAAAAALQVIVDNCSVIDHQLRWNSTN